MSNETSSIYVWCWLPGEDLPVPTGVLSPEGDGFRFAYGLRYLERGNALSLSPTLPLEDRWFDPTGDLKLPGAIRDASPDAWGRRVILNRVSGRRGPDADTVALPESQYLLESSSDRIGALDFQRSPRDYVHRGASSSLRNLQAGAELVTAGDPVPDDLRDAVLSGTGIGGARPKALSTVDGVPSMVKFSVSNDVFPAVEAEAVATNLARRAGLNVPTVHAAKIAGRYALISRRFDRTHEGARRMVLSALTITERDESSSRYASYLDLLGRISAYSRAPEDLGAEFFQRIAFNMAISNNDDHLRNHAAFWDGNHLELTPAYDLAPSYRREGAEAFQTLPYGDRGEKLANLNALIAFAPHYGLTLSSAREVVHRIVQTIDRQFDESADEMKIPLATRATIRGSFLHDTVVRGLES